MAASSDDSDGGGSGGQTWDGYSDYATVSSRISNLIFDAIDAYNEVHSKHVEGGEFRPEQAAWARSRIGSASMSLKAEMEKHEDANDEIGTILDRWERGRGGAGVDVTVPNEGFMAAFRDIQLYDNDPEWLGQFVTDMWSAGWELGYLKAGRHEDDGPRELEPRDVPQLLER